MLNIIENEINLRKFFLNNINENLLNYIYTACIIINETLKNGGKIFLCEDDNNLKCSEFMANKLIEKLICNNKSKSIYLLSQNNILMNKFGENKVFEKQILSFAKKNDLVIGISASGCSKKILRALSISKNLGCKTIGMSILSDGYMEEFSDINIVISSDNYKTPDEIIVLVSSIIIDSIDI